MEKDRRIEISSRTDKSRVILYIDFKNESYYSKIYNYDFESEDRVQPIPPKPLSKLKTKNIIEYFENLKSVTDEWQISDSLIFASFDGKDFERFTKSVWFTVQKVKKLLKSG